MNKTYTKRAGAFLSALIIFSAVSFSQFKDVDFLRTAPADGVKFLEAYVSPWANAFGAGLNGGWYNTAKPHKLLGFDITTSFNVGIVPTSADKFDASKIGLSSSVSGAGLTPSVSGPDTKGPLMTYSQGGIPLATFNAPAGSAWRYIPVPTAQIGLGLPLGTEIKGRFIPKISVADGDISLWGVGLLHSIVQYLPGSKLLPYDISVFGGYTKLEANVPLSLKPDLSVNQNYTTTATFNPTTAFNDQKLNLVVTAINVSAIASLNLPVITFYGGIGYCKTKTTLAFKGNFPTPVLVTPGLPATPYAEYNNSGVKKGADFPGMEIKNFSGMRANIGLRIKLAVITIHADYTRAQYNVFSTGLGISFR